MNTSSFHNSSIFNSSVESMACCKHEQEYKQLYEELSVLRMEHRALKNQVGALRGTRKGLEDENQLLKEFLGKKKSMIGELNKKIEENERQICRLEDELRQVSDGKQALYERIKMLQEKKKESQQQIAELKSEEKRQVRQYDSLKLKFEKFRVQSGTKTESALQEKEAQLNRVNATIQSIIQGLSYHQTTKQQSHIAMSQTSKNESSSAKVTDIQLQNIVNQLNQQKQTHLVELTNKIDQVKHLSAKNDELQSQLVSYKELFEQQMIKMDNLKVQLREKDTQVVNNQRTIVSNQQKQDFSKHILTKITTMLSNHLPECQDTLTKLTQLSISPSKKFQSQILLRELSSISTQHFSSTLKQSIQTKQLQSMTRDYNELKEQYELLLLKFSTLEREYKEVVEDNSRLIRFSSLSQYRVNRNVGFSQSKWKEEKSLVHGSDKQNRGTLWNLRI